MNKKNIETTQLIADLLNQQMKEINVSTYSLIKQGAHTNDIRTVLRRGNHKDANYTIETLLEIITMIGIDIDSILKKNLK